MNQLDDIMTKQQVADLLDCEASTIEEAARNRKLPAVKIGRSWVFPKVALLAKLNEMALEKPVDNSPKFSAQPIQGSVRRRPLPVLSQTS